MAIFGRGFPVPFRQSQPLKGAAVATFDASITASGTVAGVLTTGVALQGAPPALWTDQRRIAWVSADTVGTKYAVTLPFQPKALLVWASPRTSNGSDLVPLRFCYGAGTGPTERWATNAQSGDNAAASAPVSIFRDDQVLFVRVSGAISGKLDIDSMTNDAGGYGYTLVVDQQLQSGFVNADVVVLALGGPAVTNAKAATFQATTSGSQADTQAGFLPSLVALMCTGQVNRNDDPGEGDTNISIGWANATQQLGTSLFIDQNATASVATSYGLVTAQRVLANVNATGALSDAWQLQSLDAAGMTLNRTTGSSQVWVGVLYLGGTFAKHIGTHSITAGTGNQSYVGVGFTGKAGVWLTHPNATTLEGYTPTEHAEFSLGSATGASNQSAIWHGQESTPSANTVAARRWHNAAVLVDSLVTSPATDEGVAAFVSWSDDGYTWNRTTSFASGLLVGRTIFGDAISGQAVVAGALTTEIKVATAVTASGTVAGALTTAIAFRGALTGTGTVAGALTTGIPLQAAGTASGIVAGAFTTNIALVGAGAATGTVAGAVTTAIPLAASSSGTGTLVGELTAEVPITFDAAVTATASVAGAFESDILYPSGDLSGNWLPSAPNVPLYSMLDESPYSDTDYIYGSAADDPAEVFLEPTSTLSSLTLTVRWKEHL